MPNELMPVEDQDQRIFEAWQGGKGLGVIAREMGISRADVEQALDRALPTLSQLTQARAYKRQLYLMEDLNNEFYAIAKRDKSTDAAHLCARLNERICAMSGWSSMTIKMDPIAAQEAEQPSSFDKVYAMITRLAEEAPPARRALRERVQQLGPEKALELLNAGNGGVEPR